MLKHARSVGLSCARSFFRARAGAVAHVQLFLTQLVSVQTAEQTFSIQGWWRLDWQVCSCVMLSESSVRHAGVQ